MSSIHEELARRVSDNTRRLDGLAFPEKSPDLVSPFLALPMLRGLWVASADSNGDWHDFSGQGRTLSLNGDPVLDFDGVAPYWDLDGAGDFFGRADEAGLSITATETYVDSDIQGLTFGGWHWLDTLGDWEYFFSKWDAPGNHRSYALTQWLAANEQMGVWVSVDGTNTKELATTAGTLTTGEWHFVVGRFVPSTELGVFMDGVWYTLEAGIPASIFDGTAPLNIGASAGGGAEMDGRVACCFLCAAACSDAQVSSVYQQTRAAFNR